MGTTMARASFHDRLNMKARLATMVNTSTTVMRKVPARNCRMSWMSLMARAMRSPTLNREKKTGPCSWRW